MFTMTVGVIELDLAPGYRECTVATAALPKLTVLRMIAGMHRRSHGALHAAVSHRSRSNAHATGAPRRWSRIALLVSALTATFAACVTGPGSGIDDAIAAQAGFVEPGTVPSDLVDTLRPYRVILLGESHYVHEHQDVVVQLLRELHLHGLRWFAEELSHASGWAVDDYVRGLRDDPAPSVDGMNETYHNETAFQPRLIGWESWVQLACNRDKVLITHLTRAIKWFTTKLC